MALYFLVAYPWVFMALAGLSIVFLLAGVIRLGFQCRAKGSRFMLAGVVVFAAAAVHQLLTSPRLDPTGLLEAVLPTFVLTTGVFLFLLGFVRMAWSHPPASREATDA